MALQLFGVFAVLTARDNKTGPEKHRERAQKSMSQHTNKPAGDKLETLTINSARNASPETRQERNRNRNETKFFKKKYRKSTHFSSSQAQAACHPVYRRVWRGLCMMRSETHLVLCFVVSDDRLHPPRSSFFDRYFLFVVCFLSPLLGLMVSRSFLSLDTTAVNAFRSPPPAHPLLFAVPTQ